MNALIETLNPDDIRKIVNRTVKQVLHLGDGFIGFRMDTVEDEETQINNRHFQATIHDIVGFFKEQDFKTVPLESLDLIVERLRAHKVRRVDMVIPFRTPPGRGNYLKYNPNRRAYDKQLLVIDQLDVKGDEFIVVAMDPSWEPAGN